MSHLPPELIFAILERAYYTPAGLPNYALLANCSRMCKSWSIPAQTLLFHKITGPRLRTAASLRIAIKSSAARGRFVGNDIRSLHISVGGLLDDCKPDAFAELLRACPRLYELTLSIPGLHEFDQFALAKLKDAGQTIRALNIHSCSVQSPILIQLLGIWYRIRFLKIGAEIAAWPWRNRSETPVARRFSHNTAHLPPSPVSLYDLTLARIPSSAVLTWLLGSSKSSLCILELQEVPGIDARKTLGVYAPNLRSLRLLHFNHDSAAFLRQCTSLEELVIYNIPVLVSLAPDLPSSIEHFSFRNPRHVIPTTLRPILDAINVLPNLRILTCDTNSAGVADFESLKATCAKRGVEVAISDITISVPEDPTVVQRFPRRRSVSNYTLMTSGSGGD